jgi:LPP20 lipoprotein
MEPAVGMNTKKMIILGLLLASVAPSLALAARPAWVDGNAKMFPTELYLVGRGTGATANEAQNRARGDLATVFEVRVQVNDESSTTVTKAGKKEKVERQAQQRVSAKTDKVVKGINIEEVWRDPVTQEFHALATLSRSQAAASLREEIKKIDEAVQMEMSKAEAENDPLVALGALARAMDTAMSRDAFQTALKVVDGSGKGLEAPISRAMVKAKFDDTLKNIKIATELESGTDNSAFSTTLGGGLAAAGFLAQGTDTADFVLVGQMDTTDLGVSNGWHWMRGAIKVSLVEKASGQVRGSKTWMVKASARDAKTIHARLMMEVEKLLKGELRAAIIEFAVS